MNRMSTPLVRKTYRLARPEETLARIQPHLATCGITRCPEITGLDDDLGVPVYCAIRPRAKTLQTANGKGMTPVAAKVSALMEAIELHHAETPEPGRVRRVDRETLVREDALVLDPVTLPDADQFYQGSRYRTDWVEGERLPDGRPIWAPASAVYFVEPRLSRCSSNGLASGNHLLEASMHALYELIERDTLSRISVEGRFRIRERCRVIDVDTIDDPDLSTALERMRTSGNRVVLLWSRAEARVHTFWAVLLNESPLHQVSALNMGYGSHLDPVVAAARALTEAVQVRLTAIHGSREDLVDDPLRRASDVLTSPAYRFFRSLQATADWRRLKEETPLQTLDLSLAHAFVLDELARAGVRDIARFDLTKPAIGIPVVKIIAPALKSTRILF